MSNTEKPNAEKLSITLPAEMVKIIREKVGAGLYSSNSAVICDAMRGWLNREKKLAELDAALMKGLADIEAGRTHTLEEVREEMRRRFGQ